MSENIKDLFEYCKQGELSKVKKLVNQQNVNSIGELYLILLQHYLPFVFWILCELFIQLCYFRYCW